MNPGVNKNQSNSKEKEATRSSVSFINNAQDKSSATKSNLIQTPSITLPKGGGAIKSIDEKFSVNAVSGTASFNIPLPFSPGRNGNTPSLTLNYNSGSGNSSFGLGWDVGVPAIQRKTEKELPKYVDTDESDTFIFSGAEDLVPVSDNNINDKTRIRYRPRTEGLFARIEKINEDGNIYWMVRSKENIVSVFGKSNDAKLFSPVTGEENKIFRWCLEYSYDDKGNFTKYNYKKEDTVDVEFTLSEKNRLNGLASFTNIYLKGIQYGNKIAFYENDSLPTEFLFELIFDYGEHDKEKPTTKPAVTGDGNEKKWSLRKDPFSEYRAGFEIRTYRICKRILMFHHMKAELDLDDYLVRSLELGHEENPHLTYLEKITQTGYIWNPDGSLKSKKALPPMEFSYFKPGFSNKVKEISADDIIHSPIGIDNQLYQWTDLYNEGISGILTEQATGWFYKENYGDGKFSDAKLVSPKPSFAGLNGGTLALQDVEANGKKFLVTTTTSIKGYFEMTEENEWVSLYPFTSYPNIDLQDPNIKFLDLNGDGMADLLISHEQEFIWYASKGKAGYDDHSIANKANDEEKGPVIVFSDMDEKMMIAIADMSGDGLADIVLITNTTVCYYPNLGYGRFGAKVTMEMTECFASMTTFNPQYLHLADIDGSGTTDIVYVGNDKIQVWYNQSGNRLSQPSEFFNPFPKIDSEAKISFIDLIGNGTSCLVWSSSLPEYSRIPLRYIDIMDGRKPHIMYGYKNNLGKEVTLEYKSSAHYYLEDKKKGRKWITKLPFPVQCVSKVIVTDKVAQTRFVNEYAYHHGYYDAIEREFRGFAMVEQKDTEEYDHFVKETQAAGSIITTEKNLFQPAVKTKSWFHTGAFLNREKFFHLLQDEYYPNALIKEGKVIDAEVIRTLDKYVLPETGFQADLSTEELIECCRALKGLPLRKEVYSEEGNENIKLHPYTVTQNNYDIRRLQKKGNQKHGVFLNHEKETLSFHYERNPLDPRIAHTINIEIDEYGNVKQAASIVYGRKNEDDSLPTINDRKQQTRQYITYTNNLFTKIIDDPQAYRLPVSWSSETWELNTATPEKTFFTSTEIENRFANAGIKPYEKEALDNEKRKIEEAKTLFLRNDLKGPMSPGLIDTPALPYENYLLAFTPSLRDDIYENKVDDDLLRNKGLYVQFENDGNYWIKSGRTYFHPDLTANPFIKKIDAPAAADLAFAKNNFYLPVAYENNFNHLTKVFYDQPKLLPKRIIDAADNEVSVLKVNYRTLAPIKVSDANDNLTGVRFDELGLVTHKFVMGKENEFKGDRMDPSSIELSEQDKPGSFLEYEFRYYSSKGLLPDRVKTSIREKHHFKESNSIQPVIETDFRWQESYAYSDGSGHEVLKKIQSEPGLAPERDAQGKLVKDASGRIKLKDTGAALRWVGNGRTIYNNKGNPVKQYEPYFDCVPEYNNETQLVELGFTSVIFYDAVGRVIRTEHPNGTYSKVEFNAWMQKKFDENDTAGSDTTVDGLAVTQWYKERINAAKGEAEQQATLKTAIHYNTPSIDHLDSLGRIFLSVTHNKSKRTNEDLIQEFYYIRTNLDIEGNARSISDARGNEVMKWKYNKLGIICFQHSMDAGNRWMLSNVNGSAIRLWDSRGQQFFYYYDELHRPLKVSVDKGQGEEIIEKYEYGENLADDKKKNLRGKLFRHSDTAGINVNERFDFKGKLLKATRQLLKNYKKIPNWDVAQELYDEIFSNETKYDALNRAIEIKSPDNSIVFPIYNEANLLNKLDVRIKGSNVVTHFITNIDYNAKGQREKIVYGNNTSDITTTFYTYEPDTYRLIRLLTIKNDDSSVLQDLNYTYDPAGNITRQFDNAQKTKFYGGQKIEAKSNYIYDAIYRLIEAEGREHTGQIGIDAKDNWDDNWCKNSLQPNSDVQLRDYSQKYFYDEAGNIKTMRHIAGSQPGSSWTRTYEYAATNNQLSRTVMGNDDNITSNHDYTYNEHGSMKTMPHMLPGTEIDWNLREEMQHIQLGGGGEAWYVYDSAGQRIRKVIEKDQQREERIYLWGIEIFRVFDNGNPNKKLERETLHVMDDKQRIAMVETRTAGNDGSPQQLLRYQFSNHLGTACIELDEQARVISYEEYHPYGTTAYQAMNKDINPVAKRYRYTGMERDEESGFNYHGARYYVNWLGRWLKPDPIGIQGGMNLYGYAANNPIIANDIAGTDPKKVAKTFTPPTIQESNGMPTTQTITYEGRKVNVEFIKGTSDKTILIVGGVHQDEKQGKLLAKELYAKLRSEQQYYNIILIPDLFGERKTESRTIDGQQTNTGNFPNQKETLADSAKRGGGTPTGATTDFKGNPVKSPKKILPENVILISILEKYKSKLEFTLSIHDHGPLDKTNPGNGAPGFFLDQKEGGDTDAVDRGKKVVLNAESNGGVVEGNYIGKVVDKKYVRGQLTTEYPNSTATQPEQGVSFGTYGSSLGLNMYLVEASRDGKGRTAMVNAISDHLLSDPTPAWRRPSDYDCVRGQGSRMYPR